MPSDDPLDGPVDDRVPERAPGDRFYRGTLIRLSRGGSFGVVRSLTSGREVLFEREHALIVGETTAGMLELREGMSVGYDVGWTSHGLRVTKLAPEPAAEEPAVTAADPSGT